MTEEQIRETYDCVDNPEYGVLVCSNDSEHFHDVYELDYDGWTKTETVQYF